MDKRELNGVGAVRVFGRSPLSRMSGTKGHRAVRVSRLQPLTFVSCGLLLVSHRVRGAATPLHPSLCCRHMLPAAKLSRSHTHTQSDYSLFLLPLNNVTLIFGLRVKHFWKTQLKASRRTHSAHVVRCLTVATASLKRELDSDLCAFVMHCAKVSVACASRRIARVKRSQ